MDPILIGWLAFLVMLGLIAAHVPIGIAVCPDWLPTYTISLIHCSVIGGGD